MFDEVIWWLKLISVIAAWELSKALVRLVIMKRMTMETDSQKIVVEVPFYNREEITALREDGFEEE